MNKGWAIFNTECIDGDQHSTQTPHFLTALLIILLLSLLVRACAYFNESWTKMLTP